MKKNKMGKNKQIDLITPVILLLSIIFLVYGTVLFTTGYHTLDLAQNMKWLNSEYNLNLVDLHSDNNIYSFSEMYINGSNQLRSGFFICVISSFIIGLSLLSITNKVNKK